jgi:hypothetical protein
VLAAVGQKLLPSLRRPRYGENNRPASQLVVVSRLTHAVIAEPCLRRKHGRMRIHGAVI